MTTINLRQMTMLVAAAWCAALSPADAATVSPTKANGDFISGSGIPADNFTIDTAARGEAVALKGRLRDTGQPLAQSGNVYIVPVGSSMLSPANPAWNFDFQFSPGANGLNADQYQLTLDVDFDPAVGATDFATITLPVDDGNNDPLTSWAGGDGFFTNPGSGGWSDDDVPFVVSNSWHLAFNFWTLPPFEKSYDRNVRGEYEVRLSVADLSDPGTALASTSILVNVVPEPGSLALLGMSSLPFLFRRNRR